MIKVEKLTIIPPEDINTLYSLIGEWYLDKRYSIKEYTFCFNPTISCFYRDLTDAFIKEVIIKYKDISYYYEIRTDVKKVTDEEILATPWLNFTKNFLEEIIDETFENELE